MKASQTLTIAIIAVLISLATQWFIKDNAITMNNITPAAKKTVLERVIEEGKLRCGYMSYPPYIEIDVNNGKPRGLSVDMMEVISSKMGVKVEWTQETGFGTFIEDINSNRFDVVCAPIWKNTTRAMQVSFSRPFGYATVGAWVRADDDKINSLEDINHDTVIVSVTDGEMGEIIANQSFPKAKQFSIPQSSPFSDLLLNVATGKADIVFVEDQYALGFLKNNPETLKKVELEKPLRAFPITLVFAQDADDLKDSVNAALEEMMNTSEMDDILLNYNSDIFQRPARSF